MAEELGLESRWRPVRLILTGGTIEKVHDPRAEALAFPEDGASIIPELLGEARCAFPAVEALLQKDSLHFTDADRAAIAAAVRAAPELALVVTHGTSTMGETARFLEGGAAAEGAGKTVVLTGAMRPASFFRSDGPFNLGAAILAAQLLPPGVWGVMNGRAIPAAALRKDLEAGRFDGG